MKKNQPIFLYFVNEDNETNYNLLNRTFFWCLAKFTDTVEHPMWDIKHPMYAYRKTTNVRAWQENNMCPKTYVLNEYIIDLEKLDSQSVSQSETANLRRNYGS